MSLLALDLGEKRIGVAISRSGIIAEPLATLSFNDKFLTELKNICQDEEVEKIIIGLPQSLSGKKNQQEEKIRKIAKEIEKKTKIEVLLFDESYTTKIAESIFGRERIDEEAASIILENYLSSKNK
ncbi:MAG: Holliday junction resolvase RuvX [Candidatus Berkelbacteria bacterium]|nr:Holliday junction resolvase RuvX [Candidatus Berkelbacteria bacterium]